MSRQLNLDLKSIIGHTSKQYVWIKVLTLDLCENKAVIFRVMLTSRTYKTLNLALRTWRHTSKAHMFSFKKVTCNLI